MEAYDDGTKGRFISLEPFIHQVGGHSSMFCLDEATVCKPVVEREKQFYETLPDPLRSFVPRYYGTIQVHLIEDGEYITLSATSPQNFNPKPSSKLKKLRLCKNGSIEVDGVLGMSEHEPAPSSVPHPYPMNPWVLKCHKEQISKLTERMKQEDHPLDFIVLENLTWRFNRPCILDLKMGTRQYGDNDSLAKRQSKMVKVITTTSAKLGIRICGMQVYQAGTGKFVCHNKLYGRTLSTGGLRNAVRGFLHDGTRLRTDVLAPLICKLEDLKTVMSQLESLRLYTTSLLLIYEGKNAQGESEGVETNSSLLYEEGTCSGVSDREHRASSIERKGNATATATLRPDIDFRIRSSSCDQQERKHLRSVPKAREEALTDVRIIDFAHSTHRAMNDKVQYSGPDSGFLFGIDNIIKILQSLLVDEQ